MRRPFNSTSVEPAPRPRSEMPAPPPAKPLPKVLGMEPAPSEVSVCRYSATVVLPLRSMSWRVTTCTGEGVSVLVRGMFDPVTVMRSRLVAWSWAMAEEEARAPTSSSTLPARAEEMEWASGVRRLPR